VSTHQPHYSSGSSNRTDVNDEARPLQNTNLIRIAAFNITELSDSRRIATLSMGLAVDLGERQLVIIPWLKY